MSDHSDWDRLARYVSGEASSAEADDIRRWASGDEEKERLLASVEQRWRAAASTTSFDVDRAWQRLSPRLAKSAPARTGTALPFAVRWRPVPRWALPIAASVILTVGVTAVWRARATPATPASTSVTALDVQTVVGERRAIELPDGSLAVLGVRSALRMETPAEGGVRIVHLDGEAIFTVHHDAARPFRVIAGGIVTEDVGTEFSVRAYRDEGRVRVAVREGAVSLFDTAGTIAPVLLADHDVASIAADGTPRVIADSAVDRLFAWRDGDLVFDDAPLADVVRELSRWYDVDVRFADPELASRHLTSTFKSAPIDEVLRVIGLTVEVRFERNGRLVTGYAASRTSTVTPLGPRAADVAARDGV